MSSDFYISTAYFRMLLLVDQTHTLETIKELGLSREELVNKDYLSGEIVCEIFQRYKKMGTESWVLQFGNHLNVGSHGSVGFAALSAMNLQSALQVMSDYLATRLSAYRTEVIHEDNRTSVIFVEQCKDPLAARWLIESGIHSIKTIAETIMAHPLDNNAAISFKFEESLVSAELNSLFNINCEYNAEFNKISIPTSWCKIPSPYYDQATFLSNITKCRENMLSRPGLQLSIETQISERLRNYFDHLKVNQGFDNPLPNLDNLAEQLHMSTRTLIRKLKTENSSYKNILESIRKEQAIDMLKNTHLTVNDIAYKLAYKEPANFGRAFKIWFNVSPAAWRRLQELPMNT